MRIIVETPRRLCPDFVRKHGRVSFRARFARYAPATTIWRCLQLSEGSVLQEFL
jgi:hypothetical protein